MSEWRNWAGDQRCRPAAVEQPSTVAEISALAAAAAASGGTLKAVGAGHSFTDIALTSGVQLRLDGISGLLHVDREKKQATLAGGTRLHEIPALLAPYGLAMENLGDIDRQSISGAVSTGTHGTGRAFGGIATQIRALTLVTGTGEVLRCSETENAEVFAVARVGLGALGIIVEVTLQCVDAFMLHAVERPEPLAGVLENFAERQSAVDHFEFYWFPHSETALTKTNTRHAPGSLPAGVRPLSRRAHLVDDVLVSNTLFSALCNVTGKFPDVIPRVNRLASRLTGNREFGDASHNVFATTRTVRFREMEYAIPLDQVPNALRDLDTMIKRRGFQISFPVEVRSAAADNIVLSTANNRESGYIAIHQHVKTDPFAYFRAAEEIFRSYDGRPHWGKWHFLQSKDFRGLYPDLEKFCKVRDGLDPKRVFKNTYLERVLP
ncbi:FAD-linked oxidoreductase [Arthrobacter stackebrandtii]|uniref:FAD-linked oxidoreductase n=1 Tax=Arthrobacter stackebrandtii TaxID=272161 RepID=A0ABS4YVV8_9MICC|nr:D-arabinono-1,4-lactone oxidase [Arthrobacter stackebrandtii]MBP2412937.1 FAD-linked oxidoreductase [Arthrobacter stackebrandtii]PYH01263.1 FAD-linked oxidoreductase [Arthrobacter stackebrandtii]